MSEASTYRPFSPFADWAELPVELKFWRQALDELEDFRRRATPAQVEEAARYVTRATAVDTSAIEGLYSVDRGFTLSVAAQAGAWERAFEEKGRDALRHFEAQLQASEVVLDAATGRWPVVEALIRGLHEQVSAAQPTYKVWTDLGWQEHELIRGEYKRFLNNPMLRDGREHAYAPVERVKEEMERLVAELGGEVFAQAPAPIQAAYAHYSFVAIHPFADGNGRVARALASIYLVRATSVPFLLFADERPSYFNALEAADEGRYGELIGMVRDRSIQAMNYMSLSLQRALAPKAGELRDAFWDLYGTPSEHDLHLDRLAQRLLNEAGKSLQEAFRNLGLPEQVTLKVEAGNRDPRPATNGYRHLTAPNPEMLIAKVGTFPRAYEGPPGFLRPLVALDPGHPQQIRIEEVFRQRHFDAGVDELYPDFTKGLKLRLALWTETLATILLNEVVQRAGSGAGAQDTSPA